MGQYADLIIKLSGEGKSLAEIVNAVAKAEAYEFICNNSIPEPNTGCWLWLGAVDRKGYGRVNGRWWGEILAHRVALLSRVGAAAIYGLLACHRCDQPECVNPDHLYPGTPAQNTADMVRRGRARGGAIVPNPLRGTANPSAVLNDEIIRFLRLNVVSGDPKNGQRAWARKLGVSSNTISDIMSRKKWSHVQ